MKHTTVILVPLTADDREQFILDNQWSFKYGALEEFGERDDHIDDAGVTPESHEAALKTMQMCQVEVV